MSDLPAVKSCVCALPWPRQGCLICGGSGTVPDDRDVHEEVLTLDEVKAELHAKGYRWHFFGIPKNRAGEPWVDPQGKERYWFNGSQYGEGRGRLTVQPFGWFTLAEMQAEKFAEGAHCHD